MASAGFCELLSVVGMIVVLLYASESWATGGCPNGSAQLGITVMYPTYNPDNYHHFSWVHILDSVYGLAIDRENNRNTRLQKHCVQLYQRIYLIGGKDGRGEVQALHDASPVINDIINVCAREEQQNATRNHSMVAMTGHMPSSLALYLDAMMGQDCIPTLPSLSSSESLTNYTIRMVPDDRYQARTLIQLLHRMNWTTVSAIVEDRTYASDLFGLFQELLPNHGICIDQVFRLQAGDKDRLDEPDFDHIYRKLEQSTDARVILIMINEPDASKFFAGAQNRNWLGRFQFIASDDALRHFSGKTVVTGVDYGFLEGTIVIEPGIEETPWLTRLANKTLLDLSQAAKGSRNSRGFFQSIASLIGIRHKCKIDEFFPECMDIFPNCGVIFDKFGRNCSESESIILDDWILHQSTFMVKTIERISKGITDILEASKDNSMQHVDIPVELSRVLRRCPSAVSDDPTFCGSVQYIIYQLRQNSDSYMELRSVGSASGIEAKLSLDMDILIDTTGGATQLPACGEEVHHAQLFAGKGACCKTYDKCPSQIATVDSNNTFNDCSEGLLPRSTNESCVPAGIDTEILDALQSTIILGPPGIGLLLCLAMAGVFITKRKSPVVRMSIPLFTTIALATTIADFTIALTGADRSMTEKYCLILWVVLGMSQAIASCSVLARLHFYSMVVDSNKPLNLPFKRWVVVYGMSCLIQIGAFLLMVYKGPALRITAEARNKFSTNASPYWIGYCSWFNPLSFLFFIYPIIVNSITMLAAFAVSNIAINFVHREIILSLIYSFVNCGLMAVFGPSITLGPTLTRGYMRGDSPEEMASFAIIIAVLSGYIKLSFLFAPSFYILVFHPKKNTVTWVTARRRMKWLSSSTVRLG